MNILFTCAGRRNYLIKYFKEVLKTKGKVIAVDNDLSAPALVNADLAIKVPSIYEPAYIAALKKIIKDYEVKAVISLNDLELPILSGYKDQLEKLGARVIISGVETIDISFDKWKTHLFFKSIGINTPKTYLSLDEALLALSDGQLQFPVIIKPRWGSASIGIDIAENYKELELAFQLQHIKVKKTILANISSKDADKSILIQEKLNGDEYGIDILNDFEGHFYGSFARKKISMRAGETDKAISAINEDFDLMAKKIAKKTNHIGNMDCDFFVCGKEIYFLEMNPRFGGGYPFSHEAGVNIPAIYVSWLNNEKNVDKYNNYKPNIAFSKYDNLMEIPFSAFEHKPM